MSRIKVTLLSQVLALINRSKFSQLVSQHNTDKFSKGINSWSHFVSMVFMQLSSHLVKRCLSNGLRSATGDLNHLGITRAPCKSSISYLNANRKHELLKIFILLY